MTFVSDLEPRAVWSHFDRILETPRASKHEERIREHVIALARSHGLEHRLDPAGNLVVRKPGTAGREREPITVLQAHLDMVQEKNADVAHDFERDPIRPRRDGKHLKATGTTLGADNGIGVAALLALLEARDVPHPPLELLFTVDEETGLTGAAGLAPDLLRGRRLINVDSEEESVLTIGCAGGANSTLELPLRSEAVPAGSAALQARVYGLRGGHSGIDIHLQRGNAIRALARALHAVALEAPLRLATFAGGNAHNAIPREASAQLVVGADGIAPARAALERELAAIGDELRAVDPGFEFQLVEAVPPREAWDAATTERALRLLHALPHGVTAMSQEIPGLVETSNNLATVVAAPERLTILLSTRSSVESALRALRQRIRAVALLAGARIAEEPGYPGWKPDIHSPLLAAFQQAYRDCYGRDPGVGAVHAGLECGIIGEKYPGMEMISFGPQIEFPHSPDERVEIDSVGRFWVLLQRVLR